MAELAPNPRLSRCGCEDYEVSLCVAHSYFTRDVGGAGPGGGGALTLRQVTGSQCPTETEEAATGVSGISRVRAVPGITPLQQTRTLFRSQLTTYVFKTYFKR